MPTLAPSTAIADLRRAGREADALGVDSPWVWDRTTYTALVTWRASQVVDAAPGGHVALRRAGPPGLLAAVIEAMIAGKYEYDRPIASGPPWGRVSPEKSTPPSAGKSPSTNDAVADITSHEKRWLSYSPR